MYIVLVYRIKILKSFKFLLCQVNNKMVPGTYAVLELGYKYNNGRVFSDYNWKFNIYNISSIDWLKFIINIEESVLQMGKLCCFLPYSTALLNKSSKSECKWIYMYNYIIFCW